MISFASVRGVCSLKLQVFLISGLELMEFTGQVCAHSHDRGVIVELTTVIGSWKDRNQVSISKELITFFDNLMCPAYQVDLVLLAELFDDILSKNEWDSSFTFSPTCNFVRVGPQQVTKKSGVRHVLRSLNSVYLSKEIEFRRQTSMHTQNTFIDNGWNRKVVKHWAELSPHRQVVSSLAFVVKTVHSRDWVALVISSEQVNVVRILHFVSKEKHNGLDALLASVYKVSDQQELVFRWRASNRLKES